MIGLALASLLVVAYTYAGYPVLVAAWARIAPVPIHGRRDFEPTVSICIAVYNGEAYLAEKIRSLRELDYPTSKIEVLFFSDGSTDGTEAILAELAAEDSRIRFFTSNERLGKPSAVNRLSLAATGDILFLCDVRQPIGRQALRALVFPLADPEVGCVSGCLVLAGNTGAGAYWRYERLIRASEGRLGRMVGVSGSIYAVRRAEMPRLPPDILLDDMFVPLRLALTTKKRVVLAPAAEAHDTACDDDQEFRRKVRTLAGNYQLLAKIPRLLLPIVNPLWLEMTSHKVLRLVCPWALLVLLFASGASVALGTDADVAAAMLVRVLLLGQLTFYGLALLGRRAGTVGGLARTFLVLNAAAVVGLWRFLRGSQAVTW